MKPKALIIGGSSGLGLEMGVQLAEKYEVFVTGSGRHVPPEVAPVTYDRLVLNPSPTRCKELCTTVLRYLGRSLDDLLLAINDPISVLVYAAGYFQVGTISDLDDTQIADMISVGLQAPAMLLQRVLRKQGAMDRLILVTSTSQWTPRDKEPVYTAVKSGLAMLGNSMAEDGRITSVLVAGPAGMRTAFWDGHHRDDLDQMLDPKWVAQMILNHAFMGDYSYKEIRVLRNPARVELQTMRP